MRKHAHRMALKKADWPRPQLSKIRNTLTRPDQNRNRSPVMIGAVQIATHSFINPLRGHL